MPADARRRGLGRGLGGLLGREAVDEGLIRDPPIHEIRPSRRQPRREVSPEDVAELAASIADRGVLQPIVVRPTDDGYELVAGERRWRAALAAGRQGIPAGVPALSAQEPGEVRECLDKGRITEGQARALLALPTPQAMRDACREIERRSLSVRQTEVLVRRWSISRGILRRPRYAVDPNVAAVEAELSTGLQTKVAIQAGRRRGHIIIEFYSPADLDRLVSLLLAAVRGSDQASDLPPGTD